MEKSPKSLLKGATSKLHDGASLTYSARNEYDTNTNGAKAAIKGFIKVEKTEVDKTSNKKDLTTDSTSDDKQFLTASEIPQIANIAIKKSNEKKQEKPTIDIKYKKLQQRPGWSAFEIYLIAINVFLSVGILCTVCGILSAAYSLQHPGSSLFTTDIYRKAVEIFEPFTTIAIKHYDSAVASISLYCNDGIDFIKPYYENAVVFVSTFYEDNLASMSTNVIQHVKELYEDLMIMIGTLQSN
jgi:hypothetical protein